MKKHILLSVIFFFAIFTIDSQTVVFQKTFDFSNNDDAYDILPLASGELFVVGRTIGITGVNNIMLMKVDGSGEMLWKKTYGGDFNSSCRKIIQISDGNYLIGGELGDTAYILKVSPDGDSLWSKSFPAEYSSYITDLVQMPDNEIVFTKIVELCPATSQIQKIDVAGNVLWTHESPGSVYNDIKVYSDSEFYVSGYDGGFYTNPFLKKFDISGNLGFFKEFNEYDGINSSLEIADGIVFLGGSKLSNNTSISSVIKTDLEGVSENWYDLETSAFYISDLAINGSGNILACAYDDWYYNIYIAKFNQNVEVLGTGNFEMPHCSNLSLAVVDEYLYLSGTVYNDDNDILLMKINIDSLTVSANELEIVNNYRIFPNPTSDKINVVLPAGTGCDDILIEMWDNSGRKTDLTVLSKGLFYEIPVNNLNNGIYYLSISVPGKTFTEKIVVNH